MDNEYHLHNARLHFPVGKYRPDKAFELRVKWSVATGALIADLVSNWAR